jgi:hypothetical protein
VRLAQAEAAAASEAAETARLTAADDAGRRRATVLQARADAQKRTAELWERAEERQTAADSVLNIHQTALIALVARIRQVETLRSLDPDRPDPDRVYSDLRGELDALRRMPAARGVLVDEALAVQREVRLRVGGERELLAAGRELVDAVSEAHRDELAVALADWEEALTQEVRAATALVETATEERDVLLQALQRARSARRRLVAFISAGVREQDGRTLVPELGEELALLRPTVTSQVRSRYDDLRALPGHLLDTQLLRELFVGSVWTFALIGLWLWGRAQAPRGAQQLTGRLGALRLELRPTELAALHDPATRALVALVDLLLGWTLLGRLGDLLVELSFVLLVYLQVALYRFVLALFELAVVRPEDFRPALLVLRQRPWRLARQTVQVLAAYFIVRSFVRWILWDGLGLDRIEVVVSGLFTIGGLLLVVFGLWAWAPVIRDRATARVKKPGGVVAWLLGEDGGPVVRVARAVGGLGVITVGVIGELGDWITRTRLGTSWVVNAVSRYRLQDKQERVSEFAVAPSLVHDLAERLSEQEELIPRPELERAFEAIWVAWRAERRQGLVALCGDRGDGKSTTFGKIRARVEQDGAAVSVRSIPSGLRSDAEMLAWLGQDLVENAQTLDAMVDALDALEPRVFLLDGLHQAYVRSVGGFEALNALLYVVNATSDHHFWVVGVHRPAWWYLASAGVMVDVAIFPHVLDLSPWSVDQLRQLALARTSAAGLEADFSGLVRSSALGGDPEIERERSERTFFRLLAEVCEGNPHVGMHLYARSLELDSSEPHRVRVRVGPALSNEVQAGLSDPALFVLVGVRLQETLDQDDLPAVTNLTVSTLRRTVRDLLMRGLLERTVDGLRIPTHKLPLVTRSLRRRHFLHLGA